MFNSKLKQTLAEQSSQLAAQHAVIDAIDRSTARIEFSPDGTIIFANDQFLAAMKYRREQVIGEHHRMFCAEAFALSPEYAAHWQNVPALYGLPEWMRENGIAGGGTPTNPPFGMRMLEYRTGTKFLFVPFAGGGHIRHEPGGCVKFRQLHLILR